ncbi:MAG: pyruvate formate lyase-activating protein [Oscillospiraceae bacterium]|nr:pyruvate formate lyase-activating protein [Oscillospiraceae bacterium]
MLGNIHSTESFGTVDGPGIRFVIFFQGCPMRCLYCHNPDTWEIKPNQQISADDLLAQYRRNSEFYRNGGITATGGEPMLQMPFLTELFQKAKAGGIHTCLDTSGICFEPAHPEKYDALMAVTDLVMLDIKQIDDAAHRKLTGHSNENILAFAQYISEKGVPIWIRHVIVPAWTDSADEQYRLGEFIGGLRTLKGLDVLPYHDFGRQKFDALGIDYPLKNTEPVSVETAAKARQEILRGIRHRLKSDAT